MINPIVQASGIVLTAAPRTSEATQEARPGVAASPAPSVRNMAAEAPAPPSVRLTIELDESSERFVQTLLNTSDQTVLRRYPNASQLAFSRGVNAYMRAMRDE